MLFKLENDAITWRYIVCSREGENHSAVEVGNHDEDGSPKVRRRVSMHITIQRRWF